MFTWHLLSSESKQSEVGSGHSPLKVLVNKWELYHTYVQNKLTVCISFLVGNTLLMFSIFGKPKDKITWIT